MSSNNILLHGEGEGAVLIDSSHMLHGPQTVALLRHALRDEPLVQVVNTHLHSDHCGGNARLQRAFGCRLSIPPGQWDAVQAWDDSALSYAPSGQLCERFTPDSRIHPGDTLQVGRQRWLALAAPGHDPHALIFFNDATGVVITADALWERGFGVIFPELDGQDAFEEAAGALDLIESLGARWAIPGHGAPFSDVAGALRLARQRLAAFRAAEARSPRAACAGEVPPARGPAANPARLAGLVQQHQPLRQRVGTPGPARRHHAGLWRPGGARAVRGAGAGAARRGGVQQLSGTTGP
jgi:glyoxylase-like metal-dependent hydrolase (beta-lactamase superfamily II)